MRQPHKSVKHTQPVRRPIADELFKCVFDHFVGLPLEGLKVKASLKTPINHSYTLNALVPRAFSCWFVQVFLTCQYTLSTKELNICNVTL